MAGSEHTQKGQPHYEHEKRLVYDELCWSDAYFLVSLLLKTFLVPNPPFFLLPVWGRRAHVQLLAPTQAGTSAFKEANKHACAAPCTDAGRQAHAQDFLAMHLHTFLSPSRHASLQTLVLFAMLKTCTFTHYDAFPSAQDMHPNKP
eukprot:1162046-Pelagomonas_calceolata.AAC.3